MNTQGPPTLVPCLLPLTKLGDLTSGPGPVLPAQMFLGCPLSWGRKLSVVLGIRQRSLLGSGAGLSAGVWDRVRGQDGYWLSKFPES